MPRPHATYGTGSRVGPYAIESRLGRGGMGAVYRARHLETGAVHALKVVLGAAPSDRALARFRREAELLARIDAHPNVVRVHATGLEQGAPWCAMDCVEGEPLAQQLARGPLPPKKAARLLRTLARAVAHVHRHDVLHRDLKPENVVIDAAGEPRVLDFGIAYDVFAEQLTLTGECVGTPSYMAPEQVSRSGRDAESSIGVWTDVYGLGGILYACLTGRPPFGGATPVLVVGAVLNRPPTPVRELAPGVPADLEAICLKALRKDPAERYAGADALADDIERFVRGEPVRASGSRAGLLARLRPRTRGEWTAMIAVSLALLAVAIALVAVGARADASAEQRLARLRDAMQRGGGPPPPVALDALAADPEVAGDATLARRVEITRVLAALLVSPEPAPDVADPLGQRLAVLVRPNGAIDHPELTAAARLLHRAARPVALGQLLHETEPVAPAPFEVAGDLARAIAAAEGDRLFPPRDEAAFKALMRARGIDEPTRGRLLARRARRALLEGGSEGLDAALDDLITALEQHATPPPAGAVTPELHAHAVARFIAQAEADDLAGARRTGDLIARSGRGDHGLPPQTVARLQRAAGVASYLGRAFHDPSVEHVERLVEVAAVLECHGAWPVAASALDNLGEVLGLARITALAQREAARPAAQCNPARLLVLLCIERGMDRTSPHRSQWIAAARRTELPEAWLHRVLVKVWWEGARDDWLTDTLELAHELDRRRPPGWRSPFVAMRLARHRLGPARGDRARVAAAARIALQAHESHLAAGPRLEALDAAGARPGWHLVEVRGTSEVLTRAARALIALGVPDCCATEGAPDPGDLLARARDLLALPIARIETALEGVEDALESAGVHEAIADHHLLHDRPEPALAALDDAVDSMRRSAANHGGKLARDLAGPTARLLARRAGLSEALGRPDRAAADRAEAAALEKGAAR